SFPPGRVRPDVRGGHLSGGKPARRRGGGGRGEEERRLVHLRGRTTRAGPGERQALPAGEPRTGDAAPGQGLRSGGALLLGGAGDGGRRSSRGARGLTPSRSFPRRPSRARLGFPVRETIESARKAVSRCQD